LRQKSFPGALEWRGWWRRASRKPEKSRDPRGRIDFRKSDSRAVSAGRGLPRAPGDYRLIRMARILLRSAFRRFLVTRQVVNRTALLLALALALCGAVGAGAEDANTVIEDAARTMGVAGVQSIALAGNAAYGNLGQSRTISFRLASSSVGSFTRVIDFEHSAMHTTGIVGSPAVIGNPRPGLLDEIVTPDAGWALQLDVWTSPWGFLRGARANHATVRTQKIEGAPFKVVTWTPPFKAPSGQSYKIVGYLDAQNLVARTETWVEHPIFGDMHVENFFTSYQDVDGVKVPAKIAQRRMAMETFVMAVQKVSINPPNLTELMAPVAEPAPARARSVTVTSERLADGVYRIRGPYVALAVGLEEYVVVIGGGTSCGMDVCSPQESEQLGLAILAETKRLFPGKPIRYVVNTHPHFDHAAMLPPFAAEGITILTDDPNRYFIEMSLTEPRTLVGDTLAKSKKKAKVQGVEEMLVLGDARRRIELHHLLKVEHSDGMLVAYLPQEKILFAGDIDVPAPGEAPSEALLSLFQNIDRLNLDFERYVTTRPVPDRAVTRAELTALVQQSK
jgi:glyoxylase-like metal-dependent hydrolase (beta-lactamase superfamily II)